MRMVRNTFIFLQLLWPALVLGQCIAPFVNSLDRSMVFHDGRFVEVDARPPRAMHALSDGLFFTDHEGRLCRYTVEARSAQVVQRRTPDELQVSGDRAAWRMADTLKTIRGGRAHVLATGVERYRTSDSLVVFLDSIAHELAVFWRGQRIPIASVEQGSERPQWTQGANTVTFYDRSQRRVSLFHRGRLRTLTDSTDVGIAVNGNDIVGYWDDVRDEFMGELNAPAVRLSGMKPVNAQAGDRILGFVDGTLKLKAWQGGAVITLTDSMPAQYWVQDRVLLYLWAGKLMLLTADGPVAVEDHVPEQWKVSGDRVVYLDINREIRSIRTDGKREHLGREPGIERFEVFGEAVLYHSPTGGIVVECEGRRYTF